MKKEKTPRLKNEKNKLNGETRKQPKEKQSKPLSSRLVVPMLIVTLLQCGIFSLALIFTDTGSKLETNEFDSFINTTEIRGAAVQSTMLHAWAQYDNFENTIAISAKNNFDFSLNQAESLVSILHRTTATGAFIILEPEHTGDKEKILYFKDKVPDVENVNDEDIFLVCGKEEISKRMKIKKDDNWVENIDENGETELEFYRKLKENSIANKNLPTSNLGYWCKTKDFTNKKDFTNENINILTYTLPIFDAQRDFVGAVGIDIDLDTIYGMIPYKEITSTLRGAYVLGIYDEEKLQINDIFSYGPTFNGMINQKHALNLTNDNFYKTLIRQPKSGVASPVIINCYNLNLYGENSPYKNEVWTLAGIVEETIVTANARQLSLTMLFAVLIAFAISVVGIFVTSFWFNRPIATLMQCLRSYNPDKDKFKLPIFNITELDQLSRTISTLNSDVTHAASRLSQILALSNVPLGAIEYNPKTDMIFCTEAISYLMNFPEDKRENTRFCSREFKILADNFMLHTRPYRNFDTETPKPGCVTLQYTDDHGQSMWIQFHTMMRGSKKITVVQDISENIREKIKLEYERDYDSLTNLRNRRSFKKIVVDILKEKDLGIGAMIMWDMDNLKYINDHYGHDTGDRYLSDAAKMFSTLNSNRGVVARMSGDEFYAFLYNFQTKEELFATVERLHNRMKQTPFVPPDGQAINIRASGGIAWLPDDSEDYDDLVKYADFAMYNVKNTCRGELMDFDREIFNRDEVLISGREALNRFIENRMFKYAFQPIVDLQSGEVFAYEALMRPDCPELPTIHEVMRLATSQSRLYQIEQLTMFGVFEAVENNIEAFNGAKIFVNSIPNTCLSTSDIKLFEKKFSKYNGRMVIEIIENEQSDAACMQIKRNFAKKWNAEIALDDFGSGYSTESSLLNISPNYVKIDISIVRNVNNDVNRQKLVANTVSYAKHSGIKVIAEGVETEEELVTLSILGVDYIQGFYFARPDFIPAQIDDEKKEMVKKLYIRKLLKDNGLDDET